MDELHRIMSKLDRYFEDYASCHRTSGNQKTHALGIPMIVISVLSWSSSWVWVHSPAHELPVSLFQLDLAVGILALVSLWYCVLDWKMGLCFAPVLYGFYWVGRVCSNELTWVLFVLGWIFQGIGHAVYEKKAPAFTKNLEHLLIGPIWIFAKFLHLRTGSTIPDASQ